MGNGDTAGAVAGLSAASRLGHGASSYYLANMYDSGIAVARDADQAARFYRRAVAQGDIISEARLGRLYLLGDGVPRDPERADLLFRRAALALVISTARDQNLYSLHTAMNYTPVPDALLAAVVWAEDQLRRPPSEVIAEAANADVDAVVRERLLRLVARHSDDPEAQYKLAVLLLGHETCGARAEAEAWLERAARKGHAEARDKLAGN